MIGYACTMKTPSTKFALVAVLLLVAGCARDTPATPATRSELAATPQPAAKPVTPATPAAAPSVAAATPTPAKDSAPTPETTAVPIPGTTAPPAPKNPVPAPIAKPPAPAPAAKAAIPAAPPAKAPKPVPPTLAAPASTVPAPAATPALDLNALKEQLKETKAIGVFTKLTLKNQVDDLLEQFRDYYQGKAKATLAELRRSYDLLMMKVLSLLQDADQKLASAIVSSREAIWGLLSDPKKFATLQS